MSCSPRPGLRGDGLLGLQSSGRGSACAQVVSDIAARRLSGRGGVAYAFHFRSSVFILAFDASERSAMMGPSAANCALIWR